MEPKDNISEHYRKHVEEFLDNQDDFFAAGSLNQKEEDLIWEEISTDLDLGEVWNQISSDLDHMMPVDSHSGIIVRSLAAFLIIIVGMIPVQKAILNNEDVKSGDIQNELTVYNSEDFLKDIPADPGRKAEINIPAAPQEKNDPLQNEDERSTIQGAINGAIPLTRSLITGEETLSEPIETPDADDLYRPVNLDEIPFGYTPRTFEMFYDSLNFEDYYSKSGFSSPFVPRGKLSIGLKVLYKNTWLLNHYTFKGLKSGSESSSTTVIVFSPDVGFCFNYSLGERWALQSEGFFHSKTSQEYWDYLPNYTNINYTLRYSTIALSVKYKFIWKKDALVRSSINLVAGSYLSVLENADRRENSALKNVTTDKNVTTEFKPLDYGIRLAGEFEFYFSEHLSSAPGIFLSYGIPNIHNGDLYRTHIGCAGIQVTCYYTF